MALSGREGSVTAGGRYRDLPLADRQMDGLASVQSLGCQPLEYSVVTQPVLVEGSSGAQFMYVSGQKLEDHSYFSEVSWAEEKIWH